MSLIEDVQRLSDLRDDDFGWRRQEVAHIPEISRWGVPRVERLRQWRRVFVARPNELTGLQGGITVVDTRTRRVKGARYTPGELARSYMRQCMAAAFASLPPYSKRGKLIRRRIPWRRDALGLIEGRSAPVFFDRQAHDHLARAGTLWALVDVRACYASVYSRFGLDPVWRPQCDPPLLGLGRIATLRAREWAELKGPRNAVFGMCWPQTVRELRFGADRDAGPNRFFAPDLVGLTLDITASIAIESIETFGAIMWHTDGGVIPLDYLEAWCGWLPDRWGLEPRVVATGAGWVFGPASHRVGDHMTRDVEQGRARVAPNSYPLGPAPRRYIRDLLADAMRSRAPC